MKRSTSFASGGWHRTAVSRQRTLAWFAPALALLTCCLPAGYADWTQFRGENALGVASAEEAEGIPLTWDGSQNLVWKRELPGAGSSAPVISGDAVFVTCYTGGGDSGPIERQLVRLDASSGEVVWQRAVGAGYPEDPARGYILEHGWASNTPVTDGEAVYAYFGKAGLVAFDFEGKELWRRETGSQSSQKRWGSASSPILYGDTLIVPAGDETRAILALNKRDGTPLWKAKGDAMEQTYGTPLLHRVSEGRTDLVFAATTEVWGINPETGELRWFAEYNLPGNMSNTAHVSRDGHLTVSGGFPRTARVALKLEGELKGDLSKTWLYDTQKPATYMLPPVEHDGVLYWISDGGIAFAAEPGEEEPLWQERIPGLTGGKGKPFYAAPILAGDRIYAVSRENGTFVMAPSRDGLEVLAQNKIAGDDTRFNAAPAVSDGRLYLRSQKALYCIGSLD